MKPVRRTLKILDQPMAVASDGTLLVNITHVVDDTADVAAAVQQLQAAGHQVWVGIAVPAGLRRELQRDVDEGLADVVGRLGPRILRSRRHSLPRKGSS